MNALIHTHSGLRWIALILLLIAIIRAVRNKNKGLYDQSDKMINLFAMVTLHIQIVLGTILSFTSGKVSYPEGWMKVPYLRFFGLEHILMMVIAAVVITIGRKKAEKLDDISKRHRTIALWYSIGLVIILVAIPWPFRQALGGSWF